MRTNPTSGWSFSDRVDSMPNVAIYKAPSGPTQGDAWYPGWTVTVDGVRAEILRVNGAFRGVVLEPGEHLVIYSYLPMSFIAGTGIGGFGWMLVAFWLRRRTDK